MTARKLTAWEHEAAQAATEPAAEPALGPAERPPLGGTGSGWDAWAEYVTRLGGVIDPGMRRDELVDLADSLEG